ncbi:unnamed protein product [Polarella glacialis]|uniref:ABC transmembrane type-1 domain-containing protein n=1 Tax=Polarella glacialis TaxID=89957 RepID=A0A813JM51_POLGL|nr:unnamed protein product [Polarella glacialis]
MDVELLGAAGLPVGGSPSAATEASNGRASPTAEEEEHKKAQSVQQLFSLVIADWPLLIQASLLLVVAAISEVLIPHYIGLTVKEIINAEASKTLQSRPFKGPVKNLLIAAACCAIFSALRGATFIWIGSRASVRLRRKLFYALLRQEIGFFDTTKTGELTSRMTQDCQKVSDQVTLNVNVFLRTVVSTVTTLVFMCSLSLPLTMVAFVSIPAVVAISKRYGKVMRTLSEATQKVLADANAVAEESLSTMSTVRSFASEDLEELRYSERLLEFGSLMQRQARFYVPYMSCTMMLPQAVTALVLFYGGKLAMDGDCKAESLVSFVFYLQTLNSNFSTLGDFYTNMVQALGAATRVFALCGREPKLPLEPSAAQATEAAPVRQSLKGTLRLEGVRFNYPARPDVEVLKGLSLEVLAGQVVALVGPSGNGKSTVIGLVKRLYKAHEGRVTLDGIDIWSFPNQEFHRLISIVGQEPVLYARTIRENIVYGMENPGRKSPVDGTLVEDSFIHEVARKANAHGFISEMPEGYDTEAACCWYC